jgi:hypothetical protein
VFRGQATVLRANPQMMRVFVGGMLGLPVIAIVIMVVPEDARKTVSGLLIAVFAAAYVALLSRGLTPLRDVVDLHADARGLMANGQWLVERSAIVQAYLRPATAATAVKGVALPAWPMTVELVTTTGQLNIDGGDDQRTQHILVSLGFPLTMVAATHIAATPQNQRNRRLGWIVSIGVAVLIAGAVAVMALLERP